MNEKNDDGTVRLSHRGDLAALSPTSDGRLLVGFYDANMTAAHPAQFTPDEWDAFVAAGNRAFGREAPKASDPARLDPPIAACIMVDVEGGAALRHLNRLHGFPDGTMPLTVKGSEEHIEATSRLLRGHRVRLLVTAIDRDGTPTFELAPKEHP